MRSNYYIIFISFLCILLVSSNQILTKGILVSDNLIMQDSDVKTPSKTKKILTAIGTHFITHAALYTLASYSLYYHVINKKALIDRYNQVPLESHIGNTIKDMCNTMNLNYDKLRVIRVNGFKNPPLLEGFFSQGAHILGTDTIVLNYSTGNATLAHELTHIKNKHMPKILIGAFTAPIIVDFVSYLASIAFKQLPTSSKLNNKYTKYPLIALSMATKGLASFVIALKILHACEHDADTAYARKLMNVDDLQEGKVHPTFPIPFLNIDLMHLWHPVK